MISKAYTPPGEEPFSFMLYSALNENATKKIRNSKSTREQREAIKEGFKIDMDLKYAEVLLDFHTINLNFALERAFSNEKISAFLEIMDKLLFKMVADHLTPSQGAELLSKYLSFHSSH